MGVALITRANLVVLDEPTAGIDPFARRQIWRLLSAVRHRGVSVLLASHNMHECQTLCNHIGFMDKGSMVAVGSLEELKKTFVFIEGNLANVGLS